MKQDDVNDGEDDDVNDDEDEEEKDVGKSG